MMILLIVYHYQYYVSIKSLHHALVTGNVILLHNMTCMKGDCGFYTMTIKLIR